MKKPHLGHDAYMSLLRKAKEWDQEDWAAATRFERHAVNAALDPLDALTRIAELQNELNRIHKPRTEEGVEWCETCDHAWPCATRLLLTESTGGVE